jgi:hypothetical protein
MALGAPHARGVDEFPGSRPGAAFTVCVEPMMPLDANIYLKKLSIVSRFIRYMSMMNRSQATKIDKAFPNFSRNEPGDEICNAIQYPSVYCLHDIMPQATERTYVRASDWENDLTKHRAQGVTQPTTSTFCVTTILLVLLPLAGR